MVFGSPKGRRVSEKWGLLQERPQRMRARRTVKHELDFLLSPWVHLLRKQPGGGRMLAWALSELISEFATRTLQLDSA